MRKNIIKYISLNKLTIMLKKDWYLFLVPVFIGLTAYHDDNEEFEKKDSYLEAILD